MDVVWVSKGGLIVKAIEEGYSLEDPLDEPIQWCDDLDELKRIVDDIELNPFNLGDKVRVKRGIEMGMYTEGVWDTVHYIGNNGAMCLEYHEEGGISACAYTWQDLVGKGE
jgi:hypothetical protein